MNQQPFITLVDQILAAKKHAPESINQGKDPSADLSACDAQAGTSAFEQQIDEMVYALYGLTPEAIEIVEGKSKRQ